ncbi:hypothetical protein BCF46_3324 [Litoreibacter meonggei]|uniref:DUF6968 domain-containing protein n=1 Tax=Litoreibacter meonggei TaxID=1049199 RepID=A0A497VP99_9RHOB|nr:hypothetical protein [Litoreibacter meonggei]RLJ40754.1 hypothetical protein BCF46_3324 [Litoreibacter meonggei]
MGEPFVVRVYQIDGQDVECRFFQPKKDRGDYLCRYEIDLQGKPRIFHGYGVDQVQALLLAMQNAHVDLLVLRDRSRRRVEWFGDENLGLPIADGIQDLAPKNSY